MRMKATSASQTALTYFEHRQQADGEHVADTFRVSIDLNRRQSGEVFGYAFTFPTLAALMARSKKVEIWICAGL